MRVLILVAAALAGCGADGSGGQPAENPCDLPVECPDEADVRLFEHPDGIRTQCQRRDADSGEWAWTWPQRGAIDDGNGLKPNSWTDNATLSRSCVDGALAWEAIGTGTPDSLCVSFCDPNLATEGVCASLPYPPCE